MHGGTSEPRIQNPESGIQTPAALMNPRAWRDIRTQNPESGIRTPASRTCASVQGKSEPRTRIPETGFGFLILGFHTCWRGPCNDYQNPESKNPKFSESMWILGGAIHGPCGRSETQNPPPAGAPKPETRNPCQGSSVRSIELRTVWCQSVVRSIVGFFAGLLV